MDEAPDDLIRPSQAARILKVGIAVLYRWILRGRLPAWRRCGCRYLVSEADVRGLLEPVQVRPPEPPVVPGRRAVAAREREALEVLRRAGFRV